MLHTLSVWELIKSMPSNAENQSDVDVMGTVMDEIGDGTTLVRSKDEGLRGVIVTIIDGLVWRLLMAELRERWRIVSLAIEPR